MTGAASRIGQATALRLATEGAAVIGCDVNAAGVTADITQQAEVDRLVEETTVRHGKVDVLANVAGIMDSFLPAHEVDDETWHRVLAVNLDGPMLLCRKVLPGMMQRRSGAIVKVASVGGLEGGAAGVAYTVSKHALIGLARSIAWTYRTEGIRCNAVCPGGMETNIGTTAAPRSQWGYERLGKVLALAERMAQPDEIAALLSGLASAEAANVNGAIVTADGGSTAG